MKTNILILFFLLAGISYNAQDGYWERADSLYKHYKKERMLDSTGFIDTSLQKEFYIHQTVCQFVQRFLSESA